MAYNKFTEETAGTCLNLTLRDRKHHFNNFQPVEPSARLLSLLEDNTTVAFGAGTEKIRSERFVAPILVESIKRLDWKASLFSGEEFNVDASRGLNGYIDFMLCGSDRQTRMEAPVVAVVEAKKLDLELGRGQALAEMYAAMIFNAQHARNISVTYGAVTSGNSWQFMELNEQNIVTIDPVQYGLDRLPFILGFFIGALKQYLPD